MSNIKLVAVDIDGTFLRSDNTYDVARFQRVLERMNAAGCRFVIASGNQYARLRNLFEFCHKELAFVAENGAYIIDQGKVVFTAPIPKETVDAVLDLFDCYPEVRNILCGIKSAYCQRGSIDQDFYELAHYYYPELMWTDNFRLVEDVIIKFAPNIPEEKLDFLFQLFSEQFAGKLHVTSSGRDSIDLIMPDCHKAYGLKRLVELWGIAPEECAAFGDGGNDIEMLQYCAHSYAMDNAPENVKMAAKHICPSNNEDGVLEVLDQLFP